jgi:late competence protein required for DNA uptake (superfamily II DNA/RNA helicase)
MSLQDPVAATESCRSLERLAVVRKDKLAIAITTAIANAGLSLHKVQPYHGY